MIKNIKTKIAAALIACVTLFTVGCKASDSSSEIANASSSQAETTTSSSSTASVTTTTATTTTAVTTTAAPVPPMSEAAVFLKSFEENNDRSIGNIISGANNTVLVQCSIADKKAVCYVVDPINDRLLRTQELSSPSQEAIGAFADGTIVTQDNNSELMFYLYKSGSSKPEIVKTGKNNFSEFRADAVNNCFYWFDCNSNERFKTDTQGKTTKFDTDEKICEICNVYTENGTFSSREYDEQTETGYSSGVYSLDSGKKILDIADGKSDSFFTNGCYTSVYSDFSNASRNVQYLDMYSSDNSKKIRRYKFDSDSYTLYNFKGSNYSRFVSMLDYDLKSTGYLKSLTFLDTKTNKAANVGLSKNIDKTFLVCLNNSGRWIAGFNYPDGEKISSRLMMIDPSMLGYKTEVPCENVRMTPSEPAKVGEGYKKVRELADEVEKECGIRVLVGNEVRTSEKGSNYRFISCEENDIKQNIETDLKALAELKKIIKKYPNGFFDHFKTKDGKFGLRISLVYGLENDEQKEFSAAGVQFVSGMWYDIAIDSSYINNSNATLDHEIWHSVEKMVDSRYPFSDSDWNALNPAGFSYTEDFDSYASTENSCDLTLDSAARSNGTTDYNIPYFISQYSTVNSREDRATLIEQVFEPEINYSTGKTYFYGSEELKKYPHLNAKLDYIANWSKKEFGYVYWEEILKNAK